MKNVLSVLVVMLSLVVVGCESPTGGSSNEVATSGSGFNERAAQPVAAKGEDDDENEEEIPLDQVPEIVKQAALDALPAGKKDTPDTLGPVRIGWVLWDTGEERGGYFGAVAELLYADLAGSPSPVYEALVEDEAIDTAAYATITNSLINILYQQSYSKFSTVGPMNDGMASTAEVERAMQRRYRQSSIPAPAKTHRGITRITR